MTQRKIRRRRALTRIRLRIALSTPLYAAADRVAASCCAIGRNCAEARNALFSLMLCFVGWLTRQPSEQSSLQPSSCSSKSSCSVFAWILPPASSPQASSPPAPAAVAVAAQSSAAPARSSARRQRQPPAAHQSPQLVPQPQPDRSTSPHSPQIKPNRISAVSFTLSRDQRPVYSPRPQREPAQVRSQSTPFNPAVLCHAHCSSASVHLL